MTDALDSLLTILDLEQIEVNIFRGPSPDEKLQRVFGGQVAGQALVAAGRTVPPTGRCTRCTPTSCGPATRRPDRLRGRPAARRPLVHDPPRRRGAARRPIFNLSASFQLPEEPGFEHQEPMPGRPAARGVCRPSRAARAGPATRPRLVHAAAPIDLRYVGARPAPRDRSIGRCRPRSRRSGCGWTARCPTTRCCTSAR